MNDPRFILKPTAYLWGRRLSLLLYLASFLLPYFPSGSYLPGVAVFSSGLLLCYIPYCFPWWSNALFWAALGQSHERPTGKALALAIFALLLSLGWLPLCGNRLPGPAYWTWSGSMGVLALGLGISLARLDLPDTRLIEDEGDRHVPLLPSSSDNPQIRPSRR